MIARCVLVCENNLAKNKLLYYVFLFVDYFLKFRGIDPSTLVIACPKSKLNYYGFSKILDLE